MAEPPKAVEFVSGAWELQRASCCNQRKRRKRQPKQKHLHGTLIGTARSFYSSSRMESPCSTHTAEHRSTGGRDPEISHIANRYISSTNTVPQKNQRGDQFGDSLCPWVVIWRAPSPVASMTQIWRAPPRVDSKTMWRPSGAQLGRSLRPESRVISTIWRVATSMM